MTSFAWKRKIGAKVSRATVSAFEANAAADEDKEITSGEIDWLSLVKKPKIIRLEDGITKAKRLREEGSTLASNERYWEAIKKWEEALMYTPSDQTIFEMKAQAYLQLNELLPAVEAAQKAVYLDPKWWIAHQTLGRTLMGLGEVKQAIRSFSRALFINPSEKDLWEEDLNWAVSLMERKEAAKVLKEQQKQMTDSAKIVEINEEKDNEYDNAQDTVNPQIDVSGHELCQDFTRPAPSQQKLPPNYVCMRE